MVDSLKGFIQYLTDKFSAVDEEAKYWSKVVGHIEKKT